MHVGGATENVERVDVLIVGGGPAGLAAAIALRQGDAARRDDAARVLVVEREREAGGIPRHSNHIGFGMRDMYRLLSGPRYARRYVDLAMQAGIELRTSTTAINWRTGPLVQLSSPKGLTTIAPRAVVLATGCRERPRSARLVPGDRPLGVLTTGALQQLVEAHPSAVGRRAVVVGAEHVSFSAVLTLAHAGATIVAMVTEHAGHQTYLPYKWLTATRFGVPILTNHGVTQIIGRRRVEAVEVTDKVTGSSRRIACDTVVFTGDWIPDHEMARRADLDMDIATRAPRVDGGLRTSARGVFAAGNLLHAAETADIAALSGRHAARAVRIFLERDSWPRTEVVSIVCGGGVQWVSPSGISSAADAPPRGRFTWRSSVFCSNARLVIEQGGRQLHEHRYRSLVPNLPLYAPATWLRDVDARGGPVRFGLANDG